MTSGLKPTYKSNALNEMLRIISGKDRVSTILKGECMLCDEPHAVLTLENELEKQEYRISGMCHTCQVTAFNYTEDV
jgi:hypothetical protein